MFFSVLIKYNNAPNGIVTADIHCKKFIVNLDQNLGSVLFHTEEVN